MVNIQETTGLRVKRKSGNLHIGLEGSFNQSIAEMLTSTLIDSYEGKGNIFIDTSNVTEIEPQSDLVFCSLIGMSGLPKNNIYLKGEQGLKIGRNSMKVIIARKKTPNGGGCGGCRDCKCNK